MRAGDGVAARLGRFVHDPQHLADLHVVAVLAIDAARARPPAGRDLEVDLVGLELDERIADGDDVAFLAQPLGDARVDDRLADFGDDDIRRHMGLLT